MGLSVEGSDPSPMEKKVVEILNSTLYAERVISPTDAAIALNALYPDHRPDVTDKESGSAFLWWFWDLFHSVARQVPHDGAESDQLVAVVKSLHDLPAKAVVLEGWGDEVVQLWTDLPLLGPTFREKWDWDGNAPEGTDKKQRFLNLQGYAARITGLGLAPWEMFAIWTLAEALEGVMKPIRGAPDEVDPDPAAVEDLDFKVAAAATWIFHAGNVLYGRDVEVRGTDGGPLWRLSKKEAIKLKRKYRGTQGLCQERWVLWRERFTSIHECGKVDDETRRLAGRAVEAMENIEIQATHGG